MEANRSHGPKAIWGTLISYINAAFKLTIVVKALWSLVTGLSALVW